jgi:hypothetical protein
VPLLDAGEPLPHRPSRVTVNGTSGSGKSTLSRRIGEILDLPYTEMDSLFHGPGWTPNPAFVEVVDAITAHPRWVCEYQYDAVRPMLSGRADLVVWLDLPTPLTLAGHEADAHPAIPAAGAVERQHGGPDPGVLHRSGARRALRLDRPP